jgi:hypothetical protein
MHAKHECKFRAWKSKILAAGSKAYDASQRKSFRPYGKPTLLFYLIDFSDSRSSLKISAVGFGMVYAIR